MVGRSGIYRLARDIAVGVAIVLIGACLLGIYRKIQSIVEERAAERSRSCGALIDQNVIDGEAALGGDQFDFAIAVAKGAVAKNNQCGAAYALSAAANQRKLLYFLNKRAPYEVTEPIRANCVSDATIAQKLYIDPHRMAGLQKACAPYMSATGARWAGAFVYQDRARLFWGQGCKRRTSGAHRKCYKYSQYRSEWLELPERNDMPLLLVRLRFVADPDEHIVHRSFGLAFERYPDRMARVKLETI